MGSRLEEAVMHASQTWSVEFWDAERGLVKHKMFGWIAYVRDGQCVYESFGEAVSLGSLLELGGLHLLAPVYVVVDTDDNGTAYRQHVPLSSLPIIGPWSIAP